MVPARVFEGNRPTTIFGRQSRRWNAHCALWLITFVERCCGKGIDSYDQWGVELSKQQIFLQSLTMKSWQKQDSNSVPCWFLPQKQNITLHNIKLFLFRVKRERSSCMAFFLTNVFRGECWADISLPNIPQYCYASRTYIFIYAVRTPVHLKKLNQLNYLNKNLNNTSRILKFANANSACIPLL